MSKQEEKLPVRNNTDEDFPGKRTITVTRGIESWGKRGIKVETNKIEKTKKEK